MSAKAIFTVGHSNHDPDYFLELLRAHDIDCIVDVRSVAASAFNPHFNQKPLMAVLQRAGVRYVHLPREFGARHEAPALLDEEGRVDFEKVRTSGAFAAGVQRLDAGLEKGFRIALMCSESEPLDCHRFSMIAVHLARNGFEVQHILRDKSLITNAELEQRLLEKYQKKLPKPSLFEPDISPEQQLEFAYRLRNKDIAWSPKQAADEPEML